LEPWLQLIEEVLSLNGWNFFWLVVLEELLHAMKYFML
jgi:hypothetical protein